MSTSREDLEIEEIRARINKMINEAGKIAAETSKINKENKWYPVLMASTIIGATAAIIKLFGW